MRIAIVHDWLETWAGSERVLAELLRIFPAADLFAVVDFLTPRRPGPPTAQPNYDIVHTSTSVLAPPFPQIPGDYAVCCRAIRFAPLRPRHIELSRGVQGRDHWT